ncbi:MAG: zinc ABC transporter substrate-binding protein [Fibrobacteraceae bacterium]|nr:zinc ABC transporter substrate-binding protein [Fibrobacteraceae bacterium]
MKYFFLILSLASTLLASPVLTVAVTLQPYAKMLSRLGKDRIEIVVLVPEGSDPHTFEPKPGTLKDFSKAEIYFTDSSGLDKNWLPRFKGVNSKVKILALDSGIQFESLDDHHHESEALDPHLWVSLKNVQIILKNMLAVLMQYDPQGENFYLENFNTYMEELVSLSDSIESLSKKLPEEKKTFMVFHPSFGYFARDYGFKQLCIEANGKEPKPKDLQHLIQEAKKSKIQSIFIMPNFSKRSAEMIAKSLNANVVTLNPLAYDFEKAIKILLETLSKVQ